MYRKIFFGYEIVIYASIYEKYAENECKSFVCE